MTEEQREKHKMEGDSIFYVSAHSRRPDGGIVQRPNFMFAFRDAEHVRRLIELEGVPIQSRSGDWVYTIDAVRKRSESYANRYFESLPHGVEKSRARALADSETGRANASRVAVADATASTISTNATSASATWAACPV